MEIDLKLLTKIVDDTTSWTQDDEKVYTSHMVIVFLARMGAKIVCNGMQVTGKWITEIQVGRVTFVHSSDKQLVI